MSDAITFAAAAAGATLVLLLRRSIHRTPAACAGCCRRACNADEPHEHGTSAPRRSCTCGDGNSHSAPLLHRHVAWDDHRRIYPLLPRWPMQLHATSQWVKDRLFGGEGAVDPTTGDPRSMYCLRSDAYEILAAREAVKRIGVAVDAAAWAAAVAARGAEALERATSRLSGAPTTSTPSAGLRATVAELLPEGACSNDNSLLLPSSCYEAFEWRRRLIQAATTRILIACAYVSVDADASALLGDLAAAARRGVAVAVILDNFGADEYVFAGVDTRYAGGAGGGAVDDPDGGDAARPAPLTYLSLMQQLVDAGVELRFWRPEMCRRAGKGKGTALLHDNKCHAKVILVDGAVGIVTDRNIGSCYFRNPTYSNAEAVLAGPCLVQLEASFWQLWADGCGPRPPSLRAGAVACAAAPAAHCDLLLSAVTDPMPADAAASLKKYDRVWCAVIASSVATMNSGFDPILLSLAAAVRQARTCVHLEFAYMVLCAPLAAELAAAVRRGVEVCLMTNSLQTNDLWWIDGATLQSVLPVLRAGPNARFVVATRSGEHKGHIHAKVAVTDNRYVMLGSWNSWLRSHFFEAEADVMLDCRPLAIDVVAALRALEASPAYATLGVAGVEARLAATPHKCDNVRRKFILP